MKRPIKPAWLIRQATELAGQGVGQPRHTNLRRATSAAYYALFHQITLGTAQQLLPSCTEAEIQRAARNVSHASIKAVSDWISGATPPQHLKDAVTRLRSNPDLTDVAQAFKDLQDAREKADYDHEADPTRPATHASVQLSKRAISKLRTNAGTDDFLSFYGLIALKLSIRN